MGLCLGCKIVVFIKLIAVDDFLAASYIVDVGSITGSLDPPKPILVVCGGILMASSVALTHQEPGMIFHTFFRRREIAELFVFPVIVMDAVGKTFSYPAAAGLYTKEVIS